MNGYDALSAPLVRRGRPTVAEATTTTDMGPGPRTAARTNQRNGYTMDEAKKGGGLPPWLKDKKEGDGEGGEGGDSDSDKLPPWLRDRKKGSRRGRQAESALSPQIYPRESLERFHEAPLDARRRDGLPSGDFALPGRRYPIDTPARARAALSRVDQFGSPEEKSRVRSAVRRKYPDMNVS